MCADDVKITADFEWEKNEAEETMRMYKVCGLYVRMC